MEKIIDILLILLLMIFAVMNCVLVSKLQQKTTDLIELTDLEPEIIFIDSIEYDTVYIEKTEIVKLPIYKTDTIQQTDTILLMDSVDVVIPIELKQFSDTLANTAISFDLRGFQCEVNDLLVENLKTPTIEENKVKRWGLGVQLGIGGTTKGFSPYIGIGLNYNIFNF